jgi:hypothetical protein
LALIARRVLVRLSPPLAVAVVASLMVGEAAGARHVPDTTPHVARTMYRHENAAQALATLRETFPAQVANGFKSFDGTTLVRRLRDHQAIVTSSTGRSTLAVGVLPLFGHTPTGGTAALDLGLVRQGKAFVPRSGLVGLSVPSASSGALAFAKPQMAVRLAGGSPVVGQRAGGSVFFANLGGRVHDIDAILRPTSAGAQVSFVLRTPASFQSERLLFALPTGWTLRRSTAVSGGVEIASNLGAPALVAPVSARDALGRVVPARYRVRGNQLLILVGHRSRGYAYPILVSAPVTDLLLGAWSAAQVAWRAVASESQPSLTHRAYGDYGVWSGGGHRRYTAVSSGEYRAAAPPGAYIYKLTESGVIHTLPYSQEFGGIAKAGSQQWETAGRWSGPDGERSLVEFRYRSSCGQPGPTQRDVGLVSELRIQHTGGAARQCLPGRWVRRLDVYRSPPTRTIPGRVSRICSPRPIKMWRAPSPRPSQ